MCCGFVAYLSIMKQSLIIITSAILLASCGGESYSCICTDKGNGNAAIADHTVKGKKESAAFECGQKELQYSGPQYKDVQCELNEQ